MTPKELDILINKMVNFGQDNDSWLNSSNKFLYLLLDCMPYPISIMDNDYNVLKTNKAAKELFNTDIDGGKYIKCYDLFYNVSKVCKSCITKQVYEMRKSLLQEKYIKHCNKIFFIKAIPILNKKNEVTHIVEYMYEKKEKEAEKKLKKSEEKYKKLTQRIPVGIYQTNTEGKMFYANKALIEMLEYDSREELYKENIFNLFLNEEDRHKQIEIFEKTKQKELETELILKTYKGKIIYVKDKSYAVKNKEGKILYFEGILHNITQEIRTSQIKSILLEIYEREEQLERVNELIGVTLLKFNSFFKTNNFYITLYDFKTNMYKFYYYDENNIIKQETYNLSESLIDNVLKTKKPIFRENIKDYIIKNNNIKYKQKKDIKIWMGYPLMNFGRKCIGVLGIFDCNNKNIYTKEDFELLDIASKSLSALIEKKQLIIELQKRELEYEYIFEGVKDGVFYANKNGYILNANEALCKMAQIKKEDFIGMSSLDFAERVIHKDNMKIFFNAIEQNLKGVGTNKLKVKDVKGNTYIMTTFTDKKQPGITGLVRDITDELKVQEELIWAKEKAEENDKLKSAFLSNMSHEIRTPMNGIIGFSELLAGDNLDDEQRKQFTEIIINSSKQLLNTINDILDISKIETKQMEVYNQKFKLNLLLQELYDLYKLSADEKQINLNLVKECIDSDIEIDTDRQKVQQILSNLINNAIKFTYKGYVEVGFTCRGSILEFYVKDTGLGIEPNMQKTIFDRFAQAKNNIEFNKGGTGLGLSISKSYVELLGGKIWVESEPNKGAIFFFTIPYK